MQSSCVCTGVSDTTLGRRDRAFTRMSAARDPRRDRDRDPDPDHDHDPDPDPDPDGPEPGHG